MSDTIKGTVRRIFFPRAGEPHSGWMAGKVEVDGEGLVSFAGNVHAGIGDVVELVGSWETGKYGRQFKADSGSVSMDESTEGLEELLAKGSEFKGVGPARARKIVRAVLEVANGASMSETLIEHPAAIAERADVPLAIVEAAAKAWEEKRELFEVLEVLVGMGWTRSQASNIHAELGAAGVVQSRENPYALIGRVPRLGFRTVDSVALANGIGKNSPERIRAGIAFCLDEISSQGHTYTDRAALVDEIRHQLQPDSLRFDELLEVELAGLVEEGIVHSGATPLGAPLIALDAWRSRELHAFAFLLEGMTTELEPLSLEGVEAVESLNREQRAAVEGFSRRRVSVITGGAGVGKTYTMRSIVDVAEANGLKVALGAPTGKASKRLSQATERQALTIHKLLEPVMVKRTGKFKFTRHAGNPLEVDLVVIDEASMIDVKLMSQLVAAIQDGARLLLVGDHNQIPSVGPGAILRDLLAAERAFPDSIHVLRTVVRQAGVLARNTNAVLAGTVPGDPSAPWRVVEYAKEQVEGGPDLIARMVDKFTHTTHDFFGRQLDPLWDVQVLAPQHKGPIGVHAINAELQRWRARMLGNDAPPVAEPDKPVRPMVGDRVLFTRNNYELDLMNGTQAVVLVEKVKGGGMVIVTDDGREVEIPSDQRQYVVTAWAMSFHKAQGSEWPAVIVVASSSHWHMHDRNLLYTGTSRASEAVRIVGDRAGMRHFAEYQRSEKRQTFGAFLTRGHAPQGSFLEEAVARWFAAAS
jgi:exodeoxyribonuclease V alpha subunit